jgi:PAS domain S-box-containing protein
MGTVAVTTQTHPGPAASRHAQRMVQLALAVGTAIAAAFALLFVVLPVGAGAAPGAASLCCVAMALAFGLLGWRPDVLGVPRTLTLSMVILIAMSGVLAVLTQTGLALLAMAFVPMLLCAAATILPERSAIGLGALQALVVLGLAQFDATRAVATGALLRDLFTHMALLVSGVAVGLLTQRTIQRAVRRASLREQRFVGLLSAAADWYWEMDEQLCFTHLSESVLRGSGLSAERRIGKAPWEIEGFGLDADAMDAHRADLEARHPFANLLLHRPGDDGRWHWLAVSGRPRFDERGVFAGYWGVGRDVTAEREAELARAATEARYRELFARSPSALALHRDGQLLMANHAAAALLGVRSEGELVGRALLDFYDESDGSRERAAQRVAWLKGLAPGEAVPPMEYVLRNANGRRLHVLVSSVKVEADGRPAILSIYEDQTERVRAEAARARSEALLAHVVTTSPDLITLTDMDTGRYVMVNDAFCQQSGYQRDEAIGRTSLELGIWGDAAQREAFVHSVKADGQVRDRAIAFKDRQGRTFSLLVSAARFMMEGREYLVLNGRDVTQIERQRLEREAILENASIGIAMTRDRTFQLANPRFEHMFGWPPGALLGQPGHVISINTADYDDLGARFGPRLSRGESVELERMVKRHDGSTFLCRLLARPIDPTHPSMGGTIWIAEDVTERRAVEQALARARDDAEAANRAKSAFLANTSHEIRTPLNGLVGLARLARQPGIENERRDKYLAQIDESAQALSGVISDILDLSKIEAGKLSLEAVDFDLHPLLESVEHGYSALAEARSLSLQMVVGAGVPRRVRGDPVRVRQILSNFLSNALKFTESGSVNVRVRRMSGDVIRFEVEDTGPGVAPEVQARLFEPFTQADDSTTRRFGGTGLGLSICRELAELMGGYVGMTSRPGSGSLFWAELPLPASEPLIASTSQFGGLGDASSGLEGLSLMIVEDNPVNMMVAVALLEQWGVEVAQAVNGAEAVAAIMARADAGRPFDLVLMDVQMPVQGGHEATRVLRRRFGAQELPVIALTAAALTSERDEALAAGMNDFLTKPIDAQRLRDTLLRWRDARVPNA